MTDNNHPISVPPGLRAQWMIEGRSQDYCSTNEYIAIQAARWGYEQRGTDTWLPISTAPKEHNPFNLFVVRAVEVRVESTGAPYTSDPWCVWVDEDGSFARWPHSFAPTHWCPLPEYHPHQSRCRRADGEVAEQGLTALGGPLDPGDFRIIDQARHNIIQAALMRLHQLEQIND